jgi:hypothetical protein
VLVLDPLTPRVLGYDFLVICIGSAWMYALERIIPLRAFEPYFALGLACFIFHFVHGPH